MALCLLIALFVVPGSSGGQVQAVRSIHVSVAGRDGASGTATSPVRTIGHAVSIASSGDSVVVHGGVYNESVQIFNKTVHISSAPGEWATMDGARRLTGFVASGGDWYSPNWTIEFETDTGPMVYATHPVAGYPDQVFFAGKALRQVLSRGEVVPGTFFHDTAADRMWIGDNPAGQLVEASDFSWALYFNKANGSSLTNMTVRRYATQFHDEAAIRAYADGLRLTGVISEFNSYIGLSLIGSDIIVRDSRMNNNGYIGLHGDSLSNVVIDGSVIALNNSEGFNSHHSAAGLKFTRASSVLIHNSEVSRNDGPGIWTDIDSTGVTVARNLVTGNARSGVQIELSRNVTVADNVVTGSGEAGVWILESQNVNVWHNAVLDNRHEIYALEGPREDVTSVSIRNNIAGDTMATPFPIITVNDWTHRQSSAQMNVSSDHNLFWRRSTSIATYISWWGRWPQPWAENRTVAEQIASVNQGASSIDRVGGNLPVRAVAEFDYRGDSSVPLGAALTTSVASSISHSAGQRLRIGPVTAAPNLGFSVPTTHVEPGINGPSTSLEGYQHAVRLGVIG